MRSGGRGVHTSTRGFLVVSPGLTIRDRLRVLQPNDPDSYYASRELVPGDMLGDLERAKIVITNYHAFSGSAIVWSCRRAVGHFLQGRGEELEYTRNGRTDDPASNAGPHGS